MQKRWFSVFLIMLSLLLVGTAIVLAQSSNSLAGVKSVIHSSPSQGGIYTLRGAVNTNLVEERGIIRLSSAQLMQGGIYALNTKNALPVSQISPQSEQAVTAVVTHTHSVNPGAFLYDQDSTDIVMSIYYGLRWVANTNERAGFYMSRPADWDGQSPVKVRVTFALGNSSAGTVNWRLRLNRYTPNSGEWLTNPAARDADQILVFPSGPSSLRIYDQTFTLQPEDFFDEPYWSLFFTRGDGTNGETFTGNMYVMGVDVIYQSKR